MIIGKTFIFDKKAINYLVRIERAIHCVKYED